MRNIDVENHPVRREREEKERWKNDKRRKVKQIRQGGRPLKTAHSRTLCIDAVSEEDTFLPNPKGVQKPKGKSRKGSRKTPPWKRKSKNKHHQTLSAQVIKDNAPLGIAVVAALVLSKAWEFSANHPDAGKLTLRGQEGYHDLKRYLSSRMQMEEEDLPETSACSEGGRYLYLRKVWKQASDEDFIGPPQEINKIRIRCIDKASRNLSYMTKQEISSLSLKVQGDPALMVEDLLDHLHDNRPF